MVEIERLSDLVRLSALRAADKPIPEEMIQKITAALPEP